jgi:hypothetical protein
MRTSREVINEMTKLYEEYESQIEQLREQGILKDSAARTYLLHSRNFVRWCKGQFEPGSKNMGK